MLSIAESNFLSPTKVEEINAAHSACCRAVGDLLDNAMRCGDLLAEAKDALAHGQWQRWLAENFSGSARTARNYMRLAAHRPEIEAKRQSSAVLSVDGAVRLIAAPREEVAATEFAPPDLQPGSIFYAIGERETLAQVQPHEQQPEYTHVSFHDCRMEMVTETMQALRLDEKSLRQYLRGLGFRQQCDWIACDRDSAPIEVLDEDVREAAWLDCHCQGIPWGVAVAKHLAGDAEEVEVWES